MAAGFRPRRRGCRPGRWQATPGAYALPERHRDQGTDKSGQCCHKQQRTAKRWVNLTKFPVAFSGGRSEQLLPEAGLSPSTSILNTRPGTA
jgi:hypothetical protein